jgi:hypothetical protein
VASKFQRIAIGGVAAVLCVMFSAARSMAGEPLAVDVLVHDEAGVPPDVAATARRIAGHIFSGFDVEIVWFDAGSARCRRDTLDSVAAQRSFLTSLYAMRIVASASRWQPNAPSANALGFAVPGSRVASVIFPRIAQMAGDSGADAGVVLGHVIAHELGHLLLRNAGHAVAGLMQAEFHLLLAQQGALHFTDDQTRAIRVTLREDARTRSADPRR